MLDEDDEESARMPCPSTCTYVEKRLKYVMDNLRKRKLWPRQVLQQRPLRAI